MPLNRQRAFKLTYALDEVVINGEKGLIKDKKIAVIGAGLAGLTAAIVCVLKGAKSLSLYEKNHDLMAFQYGAKHRYIHPMIFKWPENIKWPSDKNDPEDKEKNEKTKFPILNWEANNADVIRRRVIKEIYDLLNDYVNKIGSEKLEKDFYKHRLGADVRHLVPVKGKNSSNRRGAITNPNSRN